MMDFERHPLSAQPPSSPTVPQTSAAASSPELESAFNDPETATKGLHRLQAIIKSMPIWVKQVLYTDLKRELEQSTIRGIKDSVNLVHALQHYHPALTPEGATALKNFREARQKHPKKLSAEQIQIGLLLEGCYLDQSILNICLKTGWSLKQCATQVYHAIEKHWIHEPASLSVNASLKFISDQIRLGQYLLELGHLTEHQLSQALRIQGYIEEALGGREGIGNILINMGLVNREEVEGILYLLEDSKQLCQWQNSEEDCFHLGPKAATTSPPVEPPATTSGSRKRPATNSAGVKGTKKEAAPKKTASKKPKTKP
jgi:hypothetical protein